MAKKNKRAHLVDVNLKVRVVLDEEIDPNIDPEFENAVVKKIRERLIEEGDSFITENIDMFGDDLECPYDPEYDD